MNGTTKFAVIGAVGANITSLLFGIHRSTGLQMTSMLFLLLFLCTIVWSLLSIPFRWKANRARAFYPLLISAVGVILLPGTMMAARMISDELFVLNRPKYEQIIKMIEDGKIPVQTNLHAIKIDVPKEYSPRCYQVSAARDLDGALTVEFWVGAGFPVKHSVYLYRSNGTVEKGTELARWWPARRRLDDHWFAAHD